MARVKNGAVTKARHKKVLKAAKGYFGSKHRLYKSAKEQLMLLTKRSTYSYLTPLSFSQGITRKHDHQL